jgi:hypothetical protein
MGVVLVSVVDYVRRHSKGSTAVDLARLNLLVGRAVSRNAQALPDDPELVQRAWRHAHEIVGVHPDGGPR